MPHSPSILAKFIVPLPSPAVVRRPPNTRFLENACDKLCMEISLLLNVLRSHILLPMSILLLTRNPRFPKINQDASFPLHPGKIHCSSSVLCCGVGVRGLPRL